MNSWVWQVWRTLESPDTAKNCAQPGWGPWSPTGNQSCQWADLYRRVGWEGDIPCGRTECGMWFKSERPMEERNLPWGNYQYLGTHFTPTDFTDKHNSDLKTNKQTKNWGKHSISNVQRPHKDPDLSLCSTPEEGMLYRQCSRSGGVSVSPSHSSSFLSISFCPIQVRETEKEKK